MKHLHRIALLLSLCLGALGCPLRMEEPDADGVTDLRRPPPRDMARPCVGLACQVPTCRGGGTTSVSGIVTAPNGTTPIREAVVYVPTSGVPAPMAKGVGCEGCTLTGSAVTKTVTDIDGGFRLSGVPATAATPIVIEKGRWRRVISVAVPPCTDVPLMTEQSRLPRNRDEGNLPQIAVAVGTYDSIECVLKSIGIDPAEFVAPSKEGAVHLYDNGALAGGTSVSELVSSADLLSQYNILFFGCTGAGLSKTLLAQEAVRKNLTQFVSAGGRLYATDLSYNWVQQLPEFSPYICFDDDQPCTVLTPHGFGTAGKGTETSFLAKVDQSHAQGKALSDWLSKLKSPLLNGEVPITEALSGWARIEQTALNPELYPSTTWLWVNAGGKQRPFTTSFDYPSAPLRSCGRVLYSSYHTRHRVGEFPAGCPSNVLDQEHVLEYLIFELGACVDNTPG